MNNLEALKAQCKAICSTCYIDTDVIKLTLSSVGLEAEGYAKPNDKTIIEAAIRLIIGWVENSRSEGGISVSADMNAIKNSVSYWCGVAGLNASEFLGSFELNANPSDMW